MTIDSVKVQYGRRLVHVAVSWDEDGINSVEVLGQEGRATGKAAPQIMSKNRKSLEEPLNEVGPEPGEILIDAYDPRRAYSGAYTPPAPVPNDGKLKTLFFDTGVRPEYVTNPPFVLRAGQVIKNKTMQIPFDCDAPDNAEILFFCDNPSLAESKWCLVREIFNTVMLSKYVYLRVKK